MKRLFLLGFVGLLASVLAGCPTSSGDGNSGTQVCTGDGCSSGTPPSCLHSSDCQVNETCGTDGQCHSGDCSVWGCSSGFSCTVDPSSQTSSCVPGGSTTGTGGSGTGGMNTGGMNTGGSTTTGAGGAGPAPVYCGHPSDCAAGQTCAPDGTCKAGDCNANGCIFGYTCAADGTCQAKSANACDKDAECTSLGAGYACIAGPKGGGVCMQPADQCFDQSQCDPGDKCAAGKCTQACTSNSDCRDGFACDTTLGICSKPVNTCTVTNDCGSATKVCIGGGCVPRATGGTCAAGDVWDENGCIPNQAATFTCMQDGQQDACAAGSICLHHSCWISCDAPNESLCANQPTLNSCKPVTSTSGSHDVCGTGQNLGGQCDPTAGKTCSGGKVCIDGFCK
jgi:hypothetical protein